MQTNNIQIKVATAIMVVREDERLYVVNSYDGINSVFATTLHIIEFKGILKIVL